jgi:hypothetical protein
MRERAAAVAVAETSAAAPAGDRGLIGVAMDGKTVRNTVAPGGPEGGEVTLFSAMLHSEAIVIAQLRVPDGTNEITQVEALLTGIDSGGGRGAPQEIIARYAARWSIEVTFFDVKNILGVGQARNRTTKAVQRTVPFGLFCHSILIVWYALHGHDQDDTAQRRDRAPWYQTKTEPSTLEMLIKLRRQVIATRFLPTSPRPATTQEIMEVQQAWAQAAA